MHSQDLHLYTKNFTAVQTTAAAILYKKKHPAVQKTADVIELAIDPQEWYHLYKMINPNILFFI